jgi:hypothetical protein
LHVDERLKVVARVEHRFSGALGFGVTPALAAEVKKVELAFRPASKPFVPHPEPASAGDTKAEARRFRRLCCYRFDPNFLGHRQLYDKTRSHGRVLFHADGAAMIFDDAANNRKA